LSQWNILLHIVIDFLILRWKPVRIMLFKLMLMLPHRAIIDWHGLAFALLLALNLCPHSILEFTGGIALSGVSIGWWVVGWLESLGCGSVVKVRTICNRLIYNHVKDLLTGSLSLLCNDLLQNFSLGFFFFQLLLQILDSSRIVILGAILVPNLLASCVIHFGGKKLSFGFSHVLCGAGIYYACI